MPLRRTSGSPAVSFRRKSGSSKREHSKRHVWRRQFIPLSRRRQTWRWKFQGAFVCWMTEGQNGRSPHISLRYLAISTFLSFVCALPAENMSRPVLFRTWTPSTSTAHSPTITEAVRATTATPPVFKVAEFGQPIKQRYHGVDLRWNNPVEFVVEQATSLYPSQPISCVVSLGTGTRRVIGYAKPDPFQKLLPTKLVRVLRQIATDCEYQSERMARRLNQPGRPNSYFRLNVDEGLQGVSLDEWNRQGDVATHTMQYLNKHEIDQKVDQLVSMLKGKSRIIILCPLSDYPVSNL